MWSRQAGGKPHGTGADHGAPGWHTVGLTLLQLLLTPENWLLHKEVL